MRPVFELNRVVKRFRRQVALDDVTFNGKSGSIVALLGENGAGKTTALKILLGLAEADSGRAEVFGLDSRTQGQEIRRRVGYVPEHPIMYDWMSVAEAGWFAAGFYGQGYLQRYRELVARFRLDESKKLKALSKGMRAKVALSTAMAHEPELLVLDEPTSGLDAIVRREFLESMVHVAGEGRTVLLSSHQIAEVERVADVVAILREGKLVVFERLDDLKNEVRELTITLRNGAPHAPDVPGSIISQRQKNRQWRVLVRDVNDELLGIVRDDELVGHVDVKSPSLEDIFVGYMRPDATEPEEADQQ